MKRIFKLLLIILLSINLTSCALLGTIIQLAPLAAIFVYYSAPTEIEDGKIICFKTVRTYKETINQNTSRAQNVKNEYYICLVNHKKNEITELTKILDDKFYNLDDSVIYYEEDKDRIIFALNEPKGTWRLNKDGSDLEKISTKSVIPAEFFPSRNYYAYLPYPQIKDISSY